MSWYDGRWFGRFLPIWSLAAWILMAGCYSAHALVSSIPLRQLPIQPLDTDDSPECVSQSNSAVVLARNIRLCGTNFTKGIDLLQKSGLPLQLDDAMLHDDVALRYEPVYQALLGVIAQAQKKEHQRASMSGSNEASRRPCFHIALDVYRKCPTAACRASTISICGYQVEGYPFALQVLRNKGVTAPNIQSYNAALAACATQKDWSEALGVLAEMPERSTLSCNIVLKAMNRAKRGDEALALLRSMIQSHLHDGQDIRPWPCPDRSSFHLAMSAIFQGDILSEHTDNSGSVNADRAFSLLSDMLALHVHRSNRPSNNNLSISILPNNATFDLLARAYGRLGDWKMVSHIENALRYDPIFQETFQPPRMANIADPIALRSATRPDKSPLHLRWENENLALIKKGKSKYWCIGRYEDSIVNLTIALQPHRNPSKNGMKIVLLDDSLESAKVGYLLMVNEMNKAGVGSSNLLGMFLHPERRKNGLSKVFLAIWLDLCRRADVAPRTGIIHKPLLALVLQHTFGFQPEHEPPCASLQRTAGAPKPTGVLVEISRGLDGGTIDLYAPSTKCLLGYFSFWDLKRENIRILTRPGFPKGRMCRIGARFVHDNATLLNESTLSEIAGVSGTGRLVYNSVGVLWRDVLLGNS